MFFNHKYNKKLILSRLDKYTLFFSILFLTLFSGYLFYKYSFGKSISDFSTHLIFTKQIQQGNLTIPHPGFHFLVVFLSFILSINLRVSTVIICTLSVIFSFLITYLCSRIIFKNKHSISLLITLILFLVSSIYFPLFSKNIYLGQGSPNVYHNPTFILQKPIMILIFYLTFYWINKHKEISIKQIIIISGLLLFSVLIKPNFAITYIPTLLIYIFMFHKVRLNFNKFIKVFTIIVPSIILLLIQWYFTYKTTINPQDSSIIIKFLGVWRSYSPSPLISIVLAILFPVLIFIFRFKKINHKSLFYLTIIYFIFSLIQASFFAESGVRFLHGNFFWSYYNGLFFMFFLALHEYFLWIPKIKNKLLFSLCSLVLVMHIASGIIYSIKIISGQLYY